MSNRGNRGGKREGSGRKKGQGLKFGEVTRIMRIPESLADSIDELLALKNDVNAATQELRETNEYLQRELEAMRTERDELKLWQETYKPYLLEHRELKKKLELIANKLHKKEYPRTNHAQLKKDILELVEDKGAESEE